MSWSADPAAPARQYGPAWSTNPAAPHTRQKGGWFALLEKVAPLTGSGELTATVAPRYATGAPFCGSGELSIAVAIRNYRNAILAGDGSLDGGEAFRTVARAAAFSGDGELATAINDGLSGIVQIGHAGRLSGGGALDATLTGGRPVIDGLSAELSGLLLDVILPALAGSGALSGPALARYLSSAGLSGAGALNALLQALYARDAALAGDGTLAATAIGSVTKIQLNDLFNRADSTTTLGGSWTTRNGTMGINGNAAYTVSGTGFATHNTTMPSDDVAVSVVIGTLQGSAEREIDLVLGANTAGQRAQLIATGSAWGIESATTWATSSISRASATVACTVGDTVTVRRVGNVYTALKNGATVGLSWTDSSNLVPRDVNHRLVGLGGVLSQLAYRRIDSWTADEL